MKCFWGNHARHFHENKCRNSIHNRQDVAFFGYLFIGELNALSEGSVCFLVDELFISASMVACIAGLRFAYVTVNCLPSPVTMR
uniref:Uncharacterized protein n=1 Tax=Glossina morsitans morsitans TaxID=37546 RepID=A0A1B0G0I7_GLOMM